MSATDRLPTRRPGSIPLTQVALLLPLLATLAAPAPAANRLPTTPHDSDAGAAQTARDSTAGTAQSGDQTSSVAGVRKYRKRQRRPIRLGVSGGNVHDVFVDGEFAYCSSGTLGGLVLKNGEPHILSNNHVMALQNEAKKGDPIGQPGLIDNRCRDEADDYVATLSTFKKIKFGGLKRNKIDAALARVIEGTVDPSGAVQGIGVPGNTVMAPFLGMQVKKSGRTTGLTRGTVVLVSTTAVVGFGSNEDPLSAKFVGQIMVTPNARTFVEGGDSGSAVFFDRKDCPEWVGLLFAGSPDGWGIVSPIKQVFRSLKKLQPRGKVSPIGCTSDSAVIAPAALTAGLATAQATKIERQLRVGRRAIDRSVDDLLEIEGVVGMGVGLDSAGDGTESSAETAIALHVLVANVTDDVLSRLPEEIDGLPVRLLESGPFRAFSGRIAP